MAAIGGDLLELSGFEKIEHASGVIDGRAVLSMGGVEAPDEDHDNREARS